jgi:hypothetical protein
MYPPCFVSGCLFCIAGVDWTLSLVYSVLAISMHLVHCTPADTDDELIRFQQCTSNVYQFRRSHLDVQSHDSY